MSETVAAPSGPSINWMDIAITAAIAAAVVYLLVTPAARRNLITPTKEPGK